MKCFLKCIWGWVWVKIKKISFFDIICCVLLIGIIIILNKIQQPDNYQVAGMGMSVASSLAALIIGKVVAKNEQEAKVKEISITSYRHNRKSLHQVDLVIDNIEFNLKKHICNNTGSVCSYCVQLERIHDLLNNLRFDIDENRKDWESLSPEEMDKVRKIRALQIDLNEELLPQGENQDEQTNDERVKEITKSIEDQKKDLDPKYYIILNSEKEYEDKLAESRIFQEELRDANMYKVQKKYNESLNKIHQKYEKDAYKFKGNNDVGADNV